MRKRNASRALFYFNVLWILALSVAFTGCSSGSSGDNAYLYDSGSVSGVQYTGTMTREDTGDKQAVTANLVQSGNDITGTANVGGTTYKVSGTLKSGVLDATLYEGLNVSMKWFGRVDNGKFRGGYEVRDIVPTSEDDEDPPLFINGSLVMSSNTSSGATRIATYTINPHLVYSGDNTKMDLVWQTSQDPGNCTVTAHTASGATLQYTPEALPSRVYDGNGNKTSNIYRCRMTGLTPASHYNYSMKFESSPEINVSSDFYAAPDDSAANLSFYVCGDTRNGTDETENLELNMMSSSNFAQTISIHVGDWALHGLEPAFWTGSAGYFDGAYTGHSEFFRKVAVMGAIGNHEGYPAPAGTKLNYQYVGQLFGAYWAYPFIGGTGSPATYNLGPYYYSYDYGPVHFVALDSFTDPAIDPSQTYCTSNQLTWLQKDLSSTKKLWKIVYLHIPVYCTSSFKGWYGVEQNNIREKILPILQQNGVKLVLQGHEHYYARNENAQMRFLTIGGGGASLTQPVVTDPSCVYSSSIYHYAQITITGGTLKTAIIGQPGRGSTFTQYDTGMPPININGDRLLY